MRAAWVVQGIGYAVILGALFYLLSTREPAPDVTPQDGETHTPTELSSTDEQ